LLGLITASGLATFNGWAIKVWSSDNEEDVSKTVKFFDSTCSDEVFWECESKGESGLNKGWIMISVHNSGVFSCWGCCWFSEIVISWAISEVVSELLEDQTILHHHQA